MKIEDICLDHSNRIKHIEDELSSMRVSFTTIKDDVAHIKETIDERVLVKLRVLMDHDVFKTHVNTQNWISILQKTLITISLTTILGVGSIIWFLLTFHMKANGLGNG